MARIKSLLPGVAVYLFLTMLLFPQREALAQWGQQYGGGWGMGPGMMGGWGLGWLGMIMMLAFWALVIVALVLLIRWLAQVSRGGAFGGRGPQALEILKERYARGEIDKEEFEAKKRDLTA